MSLQSEQDYIYEQAAQWLERLADGKLDHLSKRRFSNWLNSSDAHRQVFENMCQTWASPALEQSLAHALSTTPTPAKRLPAWQWANAGVFSLAFVCLLSLTLLWSNDRPDVQAFQTQLAQQVHTQLSDGSNIELGPDSELQVQLRNDKRALSLHKGVAYFAVAKDKSRPFEVSIGSATVVAVGTEFNIDRGLQGTDVIVYEGAVQVRATPDSPAKLLKAGEHIRIHGNRLSDIESLDMTQLVDWRSGWLEISDEPMSYLLERLNRRSQIPIIAAADVANTRIAGRFALNDTEHTLNLLQQAYGLTLAKDAKHIYLAMR